jgi:hypothetical protein
LLYTHSEKSLENLQNGYITKPLDINRYLK